MFAVLPPSNIYRISVGTSYKLSKNTNYGKKMEELAPEYEV
jgi:hypothetical protein